MDCRCCNESPGMLPYDIWGQDFHTGPGFNQFPQQRDIEYIDIVTMPALFAPSLAGEYGLPAQNRPMRISPNGDANYFNERADFTFAPQTTSVLKSNTNGAAVIHESRHAGQTRTVSALVFGDNGSKAMWIYIWNFSGGLLRRKFLGSSAGVSWFENVAINYGLNDSFGAWGASTDGLILQASQWHNHRHTGVYFDLSVAGDFAVSPTVWTVPDTPITGVEADRNRYACVCLNDGSRILTVNRDSGVVYRINWQTPRTVAEWDASDPEQERVIGKTYPDASVWCYRRRNGQDACLAAPNDSSPSFGARQYYDWTQKQFVDIEASDLAAGRWPTYIDIGPDGEIVYGSSKFIRRLGAGGWLREFGGLNSNYFFSVQANAQYYICRDIGPTSVADVVTLGGPDLTDYPLVNGLSSDGFHDDDSALNGTDDTSPWTIVQSLGIGRNQANVFVPRTTLASVQRDTSQRPWTYGHRAIASPETAPTGGSMGNIVPTEGFHLSDIVQPAASISEPGGVPFVVGTYWLERVDPNDDNSQVQGKQRLLSGATTTVTSNWHIWSPTFTVQPDDLFIVYGVNSAVGSIARGYGPLAAAAQTWSDNYPGGGVTPGLFYFYDEGPEAAWGRRMSPLYVFWGDQVDNRQNITVELTNEPDNDALIVFCVRNVKRRVGEDYTFLNGTPSSEIVNGLPRFAYNYGDDNGAITGTFPTDLEFQFGGSKNNASASGPGDFTYDHPANTLLLHFYHHFNFLYDAADNRERFWPDKIDSAEISFPARVSPVGSAPNKPGDTYQWWGELTAGPFQSSAVINRMQTEIAAAKGIAEDQHPGDGLIVLALPPDL